MLDAMRGVSYRPSALESDFRCPVRRSIRHGLLIRSCEYIIFWSSPTASVPAKITPTQVVTYDLAKAVLGSPSVALLPRKCCSRPPLSLFTSICRCRLFGFRGEGLNAGGPTEAARSGCSHPHPDLPQFPEHLPQPPTRPDRDRDGAAVQR